MSKNKDLLNEATVRRFMKLAQVKPLSENFFQSDDEITEEDDLTHGLEDEGEGPALPEPVAEEPPLEADTVPEPAVESLVDAIAKTITQETGVSVERVGADVAGEEFPTEGLGDDAGPLELDAPLDDDPAPANRDLYETPAEDSSEEVVTEEEDAEETVEESVEEDDNKMEAFVNELSKRVAQRLLGEASSTKK